MSPGRIEDDGTVSFSVREIQNSMTGEMPAPRPHHYQLAHVALRMFALEHPLHCLAICSIAENAPRFIEDMYNRVCQANESEPAPDFTAAEVGVHPGQIGGFPSILFTFPQPTACAEAFMTALVVTVPRQEITEELAADGIPSRYFTLELGVCSKDGQGRTVFCEWTQENHLNRGDGPKPTPQDFALKIEETLQANQ